MMVWACAMKRIQWLGE